MRYRPRQPSMLVMDSFCAHLTHKVEKKETRKAAGTPAIIPYGCTPVLQPQDVSVNKPFKNVFRSLWINFMWDEERKVREGKLDRTKAPTLCAKPDLVRTQVVHSRSRKSCIKSNFAELPISNRHGIQIR